jgi:hypothetical protein
MRRLSRVLLTRLALLTCFCLLYQSGSASAQSDNQNNPTSGRIIWIEPKEPAGSLKVTQAKGLIPINATEGMLIRKGYLLNLAPTAKAIVLCGNGKKLTLAPGLHGCPCLTPCTPEICGIRYDGSTMGSMRGPDTRDSTFPVVISPRQTRLQNLRPTIRWAPVKDAAQNLVYKVTLYGDNLKAIWTKDVISATSLVYPDNEPSLTPGQTYKVIITAAGTSSQQDSSPGLGFTTLTTAEAQTFADEESKRKQLALPKPQTCLLISILYASRELYAEAIEQLEERNLAGTDPALALALGDLYAVIGLNQEARINYEKALCLTHKADFDGRGLLHRNLAQIYENLGLLEDALTQFKKAKTAYQQLKNRKMSNILSKDIQRLQSL